MDYQKKQEEIKVNLEKINADIVRLSQAQQQLVGQYNILESLKLESSQAPASKEASKEEKAPEKTEEKDTKKTVDK